MPPPVATPPAEPTVEQVIAQLQQKVAALETNATAGSGNLTTRIASLEAAVQSMGDLLLGGSPPGVQRTKTSDAYLAWSKSLKK